MLGRLTIAATQTSVYGGSMSTAHSPLAHRLELVEAQLEAQRGYMKALEYGLRASIAAHPASQTLSLLWANMLPDISEQHAGIGSCDFNTALQQGLRLVGAQIRELAATHSTDA